MTLNGAFLKIGILLVILVCNKDRLSGQSKSVENDLQSWNRITIGYRYSKKLSIEFAQSIRFNENLSQVNRLFSQISSEYKIKKWLRAEAKYRYAYGAEGYQRAIIQLKLRRYIHDLTLQYKPRFEQTWERNQERSESSRLRNEFKGTYELKKVSLSAFLETFNPINKGFKTNELNQFRYGFEADLKLQKQLDIGLSLFKDEEYRKNKDLKDTIIRLSLKYELK